MFTNCQCTPRQLLMSNSIKLSLRMIYVLFCFVRSQQQTRTRTAVTKHTSSNNLKEKKIPEENKTLSFLSGVTAKLNHEPAFPSVVCCRDRPAKRTVRFVLWSWCVCIRVALRICGPKDQGKRAQSVVVTHVTTGIHSSRGRRMSFWLRFLHTHTDTLRVDRFESHHRNVYNIVYVTCTQSFVR